MPQAWQLKRGSPVVIDGRAYLVETTSRAGTAQRRATYHVRLRDVESGGHIERSFSEGEKFDEPELRRPEAQLTYRKDDEYFFMDTADYTEYSLPAGRLESVQGLLKDGDLYRLLLVDDRPIGIELPAACVLEITDTTEPTHSGNETNVLKDATLETGLVVKVPHFVKTGEKIKIDTGTLEYLGRG